MKSSLTSSRGKDSTCPNARSTNPGAKEIHGNHPSSTPRELISKARTTLSPTEPALPCDRSAPPLWHTVVLIAGILAISVGGIEIFAPHPAQNRLVTYARTVFIEL